MSTRSTRKRRSASATPVQEDSEDVPSRRNRQRNSGASTPETTVQQSGSRAAADAANAAAAAAADVPARARQQQIQVSQPELDAYTQKIRELQDEADKAHEDAVAFGATTNAISEQVARVVRFMLFKNLEKPDVPVKRQEILEVMQKDQPKGRQNKKVPGLMITMAAGKLANAFGLELAELKRRTGGADAAAAAAAGDGPDGEGGGVPAAAAATTQTYVLRSLLPTALQKSHNLDPIDDPKRGLMTVIAALVQMADGQMEQEELWRHLGQMGVHKDEEANEFGRKGAAEVLAHMQKARYLVLNKVTAAGGGFQQLWAPGENACDLEGPDMKALIDRWLTNAPGAGAAAAGDGES